MRNSVEIQTRPSFINCSGSLFKALCIAFVGLSLPSSANAQNGRVSAAQISQQLADDPLDFSSLHTYGQLVAELRRIGRNSEHMEVGPLIKNGGNGGLIDIDIAHSGGNTLREAVAETVPKDPRSGRPVSGNADPSRIGFSNKNRSIMAAKFGSGRQRLVYITQQHGNEFIGTEAALSFLNDLSQLPASAQRTLARRVSLLVIVRANPDAGEPRPERCQSEAPFPVPQNFNPDCAFYRFNIDPTAGMLPTSDTFRGAVGVGYNLNRYHMPNLDAPIRPVESQAMVATMLAFKPNFILDFHGDVPKVVCDIDTAAVTTILPGLFFDVSCVNEIGAFPSQISLRDLGEVIGDPDRKSQKWTGIVGTNLRSFGAQVGRHRQLGEGTEFVHTVGDYSLLEVDRERTHTMLVEARNLSPVGDPLVTGLDFRQSPPAPRVEFVLNGVLGQSNFETGRFLNSMTMMRSLIATANSVIDSIPGDGGYSNIPTDSGFIYEISRLAQGVLGIPLAGPFLQPLCFGADNCLESE